MIKRFRVALSFSGDKRAFVRQVADILSKRFGQDKILYDRYHAEEFARPNLATYLPSLYYDDTELVVVVLCKDYEKKDWCGLEWKAISGRLKKQEMRDVMLCRFDKVELEGSFGLYGYLDLDDMTPKEAAKRIIKRLKINKNSLKNPKLGEAKTRSEKRSKVPPRSNRKQPSRSKQTSSATFTIRDREITEIMDSIGKGSRIIWIHGCQGIGKTALARNLAARIKSENKEMVSIFIDLKGNYGEVPSLNYPNPLTANQIRSRVINTLHPQTYLPPDRDQLKNLFSNRIADTKLILIMDNATCSNQVSELFSEINKNFPLTICTSRSPFGSHHPNVLEFPMAQLTEEDANRILRPDFTAKSNTEHANKLMELLSYLPLSLIWAGAMIGHRSHNAKDYIDRLQSMHDYSMGNPPASVVLEVNWDLMDPVCREMWADLSELPGTFDIRAVQALWGTDQEATQNLFESILKLRLVEVNSESGRFSLHSVARSFTSRQVTEARKKRNTVRYVSHYLEALDKVNNDYKNGKIEAFACSRALRGGSGWLDSVAHSLSGRLADC